MSQGTDGRPVERWGSKIGVILAVAGSAVGLGNFLRFPGQAAANGGGAFMIPYFISFLLVGIPICWAEWTMGRYGGKFGFNSSPGIFSVLWKRGFSKYLGALAMLIPIVIYMYYVYIEAWCLAYAVQYATGGLDLGKNPAGYQRFFTEFTGIEGNGKVFSDGIQPIFWFFVATFLINFVFIYRGLNKGIETFCKIAMPLLILAAIGVVVRVLTFPEQPLPVPWQVGLKQALPDEGWQSLDALAVAPDTTPKAMRDAVDKALEGYFEAIVHKAPGYDPDVPILPPAGFEKSLAGYALAMAELRAGETGTRYREWIVESRDGLDRDTKIALQQLEGDQLDAIDEKTDTAEIETRRRELLATSPAGAMPSLADAFASIDGVADSGDPMALQERSAGLEVSALPRTVFNGLGYMWNPDFNELRKPSVWLAAAGQIFFSLSVGFGIVLTYSSYLRKDDDVVLSGLTASATNEFCEVILGGLVAIPATFLFLGTAMTIEVIDTGSTFGLGFNTLPTVFANMPAGRWFGMLWFGLLFLAAVTSSLSMLQPAIAFLEEGFGLKRHASVAALGLVTATGSLFVIYFGGPALGAMDDWIGTVAIYLLATIEVLLFGWVIGVEEGLREAHRGANLRIPKFFAFILKWVTPTFLLVIFAGWIYTSLLDKIEQIRQTPAVLLTVIYMAIILAFLALLVHLAGDRWRKLGMGETEVEQ